MEKSSFITIVTRLRPSLESSHFKTTNLSAETKMSIFIVFVRGNGLHTFVGDHYLHRTDKSTTCRVINEVSRVICKLLPEFVTIPSKEARKEMSRKNKEEFGIYAWGNLDGTHVEVLPRNLPGINKKQWFGRKKYASINCLAAVTRDGQFCFISNSHPGSVHDSSLFMTSPLWTTLSGEEQDEDEPLVLLADLGFPLTRVTITPVRRTGSRPRPRPRSTPRTRSCAAQLSASLGSLSAASPSSFL